MMLMSFEYTYKDMYFATYSIGDFIHSDVNNYGTSKTKRTYSSSELHIVWISDKATHSNRLP